MHSCPLQAYRIEVGDPSSMKLISTKGAYLYALVGEKLKFVGSGLVTFCVIFSELYV